LLLLGFAFERTGSTCVFSGLLLSSICASVIFVKQNGQAGYVCAGSCCKFKVLSGVVKVFPHAGFGQVNVLETPVRTLYLPLDISVKNSKFIQQLPDIGMIKL